MTSIDEIFDMIPDTGRMDGVRKKGEYYYKTDGTIAVRTKTPPTGDAEVNGLADFAKNMDVFFDVGVLPETVALTPITDALPKCERCNGTGLEWYEDCPDCDGCGLIPCPECGNEMECEECGGFGEIKMASGSREEPCFYCGGTGFTKSYIPLDSHISLRAYVVRILQKAGVKELRRTRNKFRFYAKAGDMEFVVMVRSEE